MLFFVQKYQSNPNYIQIHDDEVSKSINNNLIESINQSIISVIWNNPPRGQDQDSPDACPIIEDILDTDPEAGAGVGRAPAQRHTRVQLGAHLGTIMLKKYGTYYNS